MSRKAFWAPSWGFASLSDTFAVLWSAVASDLSAEGGSATPLLQSHRSAAKSAVARWLPAHSEIFIARHVRLQVWATRQDVRNLRDEIFRGLEKEWPQKAQNNELGGLTLSFH